MINFTLKKVLKRLYLFLICFSVIGGLNAQNTPPGANTDAECGGDCWDLFNWSPVQDGAGNNIPNFAEGTANDANCSTTIDATVEYTGADSNGPDLTGVEVGANLQGASTDQWVFSFGEALTNPVFDFDALMASSVVCFTDCDGNAIALTNMANNAAIPTGCFSTNLMVQVVGTYDCINISVTTTGNDAYDISVGTCLSNVPLPPCTACGPNEDFEYINLTNKTGSGTGATADIELNGVLYGSAEVLFSDVDINEDLSGTKFGAFDNDGGTYLLALTFCEPITIQQFEIKGLEVESQASIGTTISGSGASATLGGITLTQCAGSNRMSPNDGAPNLIITDGPGCSANPNGSYTVGAITTDILYFKYHNPPMGCVYDYVGFKIGTCVPDGSDAIPVCPLSFQTYTIDIDDYLTNGEILTGGNANAFQIMRDANGNFFDQNCAQIENDVNNANTLPVAVISPCAELVNEEECFFCDPPPPCSTCPAGTDYSLINLQNGNDDDGDGLDEGEIYINGVCVGQFDVVYSDLDVREDVSGTQFGGFDNDGGVYVLQLDFCDPLAIQQLDIRNLEVESQVSIGTSISGTPGPGAPATLSGLDLTWCAGSTRMLPEDPPVNQVITDGPGCGANPNASYTLGGASVSTLYFQYHNPTGGCSFDYIGFRIGTCYSPPPMATPVCPVEIVRITCDMDDVIANGANNSNTDEYALDGNGNYFDYQNCSATALQDAVTNSTPLQTVDIGCAEMVETVEECDYDCTIPPTCAGTTCPANSTFDYISLDQDGTNGAGFPMGTVTLDGVKLGTYEFLFSDLDVSEDGNGTTFGGWDNDGGTMLIRLDFCDPLTIQELDIRNLEVESQVSIGTTISGSGAAAVLGGQTLTICDDPSGRMGVGPAPNEVITDGPGCGANPNGTYTVGTNPVTTLYFKYHNPPGGCRGDYIGFRIGVCNETPPMALPTCPLALYEIDECPNDPNNPLFNAMLDANGNWFDYNVCPTTLPTAPEQTIKISACATTTFIEDCNVCCMLEVVCPPSSLGTITCNDPIPPAATNEAEFEALGGDIDDDPGYCGTLVITHQDVFTPPDPICDGRMMTRTYTIMDDNTTVTCTQTLTISPPNGPTIQCPADMTVECLANIAAGTPTVTTDCNLMSSVGTVGPTLISGQAGCDGAQYTIVYTATDDCGRTASCTQTWTLANAGPTIQCPADMTVQCASDIVAGTPMTSTSCMLGSTVTNVGPTLISGQAGCDGAQYTIVYTVTDECQRTASCTQTWTLANNGPVITCPADMTVECFSDIVVNANDATATTDCMLGVTFMVSAPVQDGPDDCPGTTYTYTYTATDECGRTDECEQVFTIDNAGPVIVCPADMTVQCVEDIVTDPTNLTVTVSCGLSFIAYVKNPMISGIPGCDGSVYTYIYKVQDECGRTTQCEQQFFIENDAPTVTVPAGATVECFEDIQVDPSDATVLTDCPSDTYTLTILTPEFSGPNNCPGTEVTYTYRVKDHCNRIVEADRVFTIGQNAPPAIVAPADVTCSCLGGITPNPDHAIVTTACAIGSTQVTVTGPQVFGPVDCNGTVYRYTYTVTDECGRMATDIQDFTVNNGPPVFESCPDDNWLVLNCEDYGGESGTIDVIEAWIASVKASTSCGVELTVFNNFNPNNINTCVNNGYNTVTFRATDNCGRSSFCTGVYVVVDTEAPEIIEEAQDHWEMCNYNTQANLTAWVQNHGGALASDGCSGSNISWQASPANPTINCVGAMGTTSVTVTFIVTDNCGNKTSTTATFNALMAPGNDLNNPDDELFSAFNDQIDLFQNRPNPFRDETLISFNLPKDTLATLTIYDVNGRILKVIKGDFNTGYNEVPLSASDLGASGVMYYRLMTDQGTVTKTMLLIE